MPNPAFQELLSAYKPIWALNHASAIFEWDSETYMPIEGAKSRGFAQAEIALMKQEHMKNLEQSIVKVQKLPELGDHEKGVLRVLGRELEYYQKVPPWLIEELEKVTAEATVVWRAARKKSDFSIFKPFLEKIVTFKQTEADKLGYAGHPYNALLNLFEEDLTTDDVDRMFSGLIPESKKILEKVVSNSILPSTHPLEEMEYEQDAMKKVNLEVLRFLEMPEQTFRMDVSTHPFTVGMSLEDVRITTRYEGKSFRESMYSVIHECGHALYDLQIDRSLEYTPIAGGTSLGVHESQSRFWENIVGRSRDFTRLIYPMLKSHLRFLSTYDEDEVYRYFNMVRPNTIRVAADELTYNFHILLRYEIEKKLVAGDVLVEDAPSLWNEMMEKYLGIKPKSASEGILQDVHWSGGMIGYFPTYSLGNVLSGMLLERLQKDIELGSTVRDGKLNVVKNWLREHVHKWGATYSPKELQEKLFGDQYVPKPLVRYLERKYLG
ncbi:MAG: carboxypeptidase M32 [Candidatus Bathyarchaeia archaeon]